MILRGNLAICEPTEGKEPFLILLEKSVFGDFQILKKVPCLYLVKAIEDFDFEVQNQFLDGNRKLVAVTGSNLQHPYLRQKRPDQASGVCMLMCCEREVIENLCSVYIRSR